LGGNTPPNICLYLSFGVLGMLDQRFTDFGGILSDEKFGFKGIP